MPEAATRLDGPGADDIREAETDAPDHGRATVRPHDEQAPPPGLLLEPDLLVDGHVVAEDEHVEPGLQGVHGLREGVLTGHRDEGQAGAARPRRGARRPRVEGGPAQADGACASSTAAGERLAEGDLRGREGVVVHGPDGDHEVVGPGVGRHGEAHPAHHVHIEVRGHGDLGGRHPFDVADHPADLEQGDGVVVGTGAHLDAFSLARHIASRTLGTGTPAARRPIRAPCARAEPELAPTPSRSCPTAPTAAPSAGVPASTNT